jgi:hypothetical protein
MRRGTGSSWRRHAIVAPFIAVLLVAGIASRFSSAGIKEPLDGNTYGFSQKFNFKMKSGKFGFRFAYHPFGQQIRFGEDGPGTFTFIGAGPKVGAVFSDVDGTYTETKTGVYALEIPLAKENAMQQRLRSQFLKDAKQDEGLRGIDAVTDLLDLPAINVEEDGTGKIVMDLPALTLSTPPSHTFYKNKQRDLTGGANAHDNVVADEIPVTGPSDIRTAATGAMVAMVAIGTMWWRRRIAPAG